MSADRQRLTSAIRRIAKTDPEIRGLLDAADNKGGKPGAASVGSSTDAESQRICCDGSVSDNANPGVDTRDTTDGDQDGLDTNDPPNLGDLDGGCLTGVTNCDTGESVCFCGDGFIPPDGWDGPDDPPPIPTVTSEPDCFGTSIGDEVWYTGDGRLWSKHDAVCEDYADIKSSGDYFLVDPCINEDPIDCGAIGSRYPTLRRSNEVFEEAPPSENPTWPSDGCTNLAIKNGTIVGSKYDPENDGSYSAPRSEIHLCDGTDDMYLKPSGSVAGGWKTINSTKTEGYLYNSKFEQIAHIDGNEYSDPSV